MIDHNDALLTRAERHFAGTDVVVIPSTGEQGLSGARNTGVTAAGSPVVAFLDDDAAATDASWLAELTRPFDDATVVGTGGLIVPNWEGGAAPRWFPDEFNWVIGCSYRGLPEGVAEIRNPIGAAMAFRRDAMIDVGGFSSRLGRVGNHLAGGEETDLAIRATAATSGIVLHAPAARVDHRVPAARQRLGYFVRRCYGEGRSKAVLAGRVGGAATTAERSYLGTLVSGVAGRLVAAVRQRSVSPLAQIAVIGIGTGVTAAGYLIGTVQRRVFDRTGTAT